MAIFQITAPNGKKYKITGDNAEGALAALKKMLGETPADASAAAPGAQPAVAASGLPDNAALMSAGPGPTGRIDPALYDMGAIGRRFVPGEKPNSPPNGMPETVTAADGTQMVYNPDTGQYTSRELLANNLQPNMAQSAILGAADAVNLGAGDEAIGAVAGPLARETIRANLDASRRDHPIASAAGSVGGALAIPVPGAGGVKTVGQAMAYGAKVGAATGGLYAAASADGSAIDRIKSGLQGAVAGAIVGAAVPAVVNFGAKAWRNAFGVSAKKPSLESLRAAKTAAYKAVDDAGERFSPDELATLGPAARKSIEGSYNYFPETDKGTTAALDMLDGLAGQNLTLGQVDKARQGLWSLYNRTKEPGVLDAIDAIDELVSSRQSPSDLLDAARLSNARYKKAELLENAFQKARDQTNSTGSGGNILNKYRQAVTSIINDPKRAKWFSSSEIETMRGFIEGSIGENLMRRIGKLAPGGNGLMQALNLFGAASFGAPAIAVSAGATGAKFLSDRATEKAAEGLIGKVAGGATASAPAAAVSAGGQLPAVAGVEAGRAANATDKPWLALRGKY